MESSPKGVIGNSAVFVGDAPANPIVEPTANVNDQLLEQLITESAKVEEQRQTINQLEREKLHLKGKIQSLEQHTNQQQ